MAKAVGDAPENVRVKRGKRGKVPASGGMCALSALEGLNGYADLVALAAKSFVS
jgi:hypothetical protein